jgi:membrane-associated phospholipid phosphatase
VTIRRVPRVVSWWRALSQALGVVAVLAPEVLAQSQTLSLPLFHSQPQSLAARPAPMLQRPAFIPVQRGAAGVRRADVWKAGGFAVAAALVATADRRGDAWARRPGVRDNATLRGLSDVGDVTGTYVAMGVGPGTWLLGRVRHDSGTAVLGLRTTEAVALSAVSIAAIKAIAGRTRPYASADNSPHHWDLFGGVRSDSTRSFASAHSAMSAAAAVTLAAEWRRQGKAGWKTVGPPLVYALASLTAGSRVRDRQHWLSDVVTGSAVGMVSALVVRRWHDAHPRSRIDRTFLPR